MKKLLLSSIIMFGICGFATAQNATGSKLGKQTTTTSSVAPTPQKSASAAAVVAPSTTSDAVAPASDKTSAAAATTTAPAGKRVSKTEAAAVTVSADGTVASDVQTKEAVKPAAPVRKN